MLGSALSWSQFIVLADLAFWGMDGFNEIWNGLVTASFELGLLERGP